MHIVVEGMGGCGKTTQVNLLYKYLSIKNKNVIVTCEPGSKSLESEYGEIRKWLLEDEFIKSQPLVQTLLFFADRIIHMEKVVHPHISDGYDIIQDRNFISSIVYQCLERDINTDFVNRLMREYGARKLIPDKFVLIDLDPETAYDRLQTRNKQHNFNQVDLNKLIKRREYYKMAVNSYIPRENLCIVDGNKSKDEVFMDIIYFIERGKLNEKLLK